MSVESIQASLEQLGYKLISHGNHWRAPALYRNGTNPTSLQIYKDTGIWKDFVEDTAYLPFATLVEATLKTNDKKVIQSFLAHGSSADLPPQPVQKMLTEKIYNPAELERLFPHYKFYEERGIEDVIIKFLKAGLASEGKLYQRFVFPIFNENSEIHGFSGRDMLNKPNRPKWKHVGRKSSWVYPLYVKDSKGKLPIMEEILSRKSVLLVESIGDLLNLHQHGFKNVLVTFGLTIGSKLLSYLISLNVEKVYICFNNDTNSDINRGEVASAKLYLKLLSFFNKERIFINLPTQNDFGEMNENDFEKWKKRFKTLNFAETKEYILEVIEASRAKKELSAKLIANLKTLDE